jgi:hypothetical protein
MVYRVQNNKNPVAETTGFSVAIYHDASIA